MARLSEVIKSGAVALARSVYLITYAAGAGVGAVVVVLDGTRVVGARVAVVVVAELAAVVAVEPVREVAVTVNGGGVVVVALDVAVLAREVDVTAVGAPVLVRTAVVVVAARALVVAAVVAVVAVESAAVVATFAVDVVVVAARLVVTAVVTGAFVVVAPLGANAPRFTYATMPNSSYWPHDENSVKYSSRSPRVTSAATAASVKVTFATVVFASQMRA
jgi:hypothetical protein